MEIDQTLIFGMMRVDSLGLTMLLLIGLMGAVIWRYSANYLAGDERQGCFRRWLLATVGCVLVLVVSNHLLLLAAAWIGTSLSLHRLLTLYPERPAALLAAHKKFLISRAGDVLLLGGFLLLGRAYGTFQIDTLLVAAAGGSGLPLGVQVACMMLALAAILKCAQLPFHGWLIQVMEAPTPVSALLHAGVINLGGFLIIRLSPIMSQAEAANWLLIVFGASSAVVAGLVMMTRVSVKVMLAWSTCAQMGFMLLECGLGAYSLALLHLVAHSLYKGWAFLGAGRTVTETLRRSAVQPQRSPQLLHWLGALVIAGATVALMAMAFGLSPAAEPSLWALGFVLAVAMATMVAEGMALTGYRPWAHIMGATFLMATLYMGWHHAFAGLFASVAVTGQPPAAALVFVVAAFLLQYAALMSIRLFPQTQLIRRLHALFYHGLYLDELFTFMTLRLWPQKR